MSSRDRILAALRRNVPPPAPLPEPAAFEQNASGLAERFAAAVAVAGGEVVRTTPSRLGTEVAARYPDAGARASMVEGVSGPVPLAAVARPHDLADLDLLVCRGALGVAENGAVWVGEAAMGHRAAPFLAQHLALVLGANALVPTLHEAYARLDVAAEGFGAWIAGPSKTADIEQSLVIGAHGPRSLTVFLLG